MKTAPTNGHGLPYSRIFGMWWASGDGKLTATILSAVLMLAFGTATAWNRATEVAGEAYQAEIAELARRNYEAVFDNRCIVVAQLNQGDPRTWPMPAMCVEILNQTRAGLGLPPL